MHHRRKRGNWINLTLLEKLLDKKLQSNIKGTRRTEAKFNKLESIEQSNTLKTPEAQIFLFPRNYITA